MGHHQEILILFIKKLNIRKLECRKGMNGIDIKSLQKNKTERKIWGTLPKMKKNVRKCVLLFISFILVFTTVAVCGNQNGGIVSSAVKKGMRREGKYYYYYSKGR